MQDKNWIDAHCHLSDPRLDATLAEVLFEASQAGIQRFIQGGVSPEDWQRQLILFNKTKSHCFPVFGVHPEWAARSGRNATFDALRLLPEWLPHAKGLGEIGLDFRESIHPDTHSFQLELFTQQLQLNLKWQLPVVLHIVRSHPEALSVLKCHPGALPRGGIVHAFTGSYEIARRYLDLGLSISVGGKLARSKGFETLRRAVIRLPSDSLVIETDSPDQPPPSHEGRLNHPVTLLEVAQAVANLRSTSPETVLDQSRVNLERIFGC